MAICYKLSSYKGLRHKVIQCISFLTLYTNKILQKEYREMSGAPYGRLLLNHRFEMEVISEISSTLFLLSLGQVS